MFNGKREPKVLQVLGGPGGTWGGGGVVVMSITQGLLQRGWSVGALCLSDISAARFAEAGATVFRSRLWRREIHPWYDLLAFIELYRLCRRERFTIVNTHTSKGGILGRLAARLAGVPVVIHTAHGYIFNEVESQRRAAFYRWLERIATHFCDLVISVNAEERRIAVAEKVVPADKIVTVLNGIQVRKFSDVGDTTALRRELDPTETAVLIGTTGRLMPQKGYIHLVNAIPEILKNYPQAQFVFVGDGPLENELKQQAKALNVYHACQFLGFRDDVPQLLNVFDIFVLPSLWEGLSISLLEGMAAGRAVVTTDIKGNREVIAHGEDGLLVSPADPRALAEAVNALIVDKTKAEELGRRAQLKIKTLFSEQAMVNQTLDHYSALYLHKVGKRPRISWSELRGRPR
jgi:glycosyltransferase involved in cell wall biosynthesis